jgi:hypothetical protein
LPLTRGRRDEHASLELIFAAFYFALYFEAEKRRPNLKKNEVSKARKYSVGEKRLFTDRLYFTAGKLRIPATH